MSSPIAARSFMQRSLVVLGASIALLAGLSVGAVSAEARPDAGEPGASRVCGPFDDPRTFPVERLGNHLVRCDYLVR